jgi:SAM-dependent methyltransferase
VATDIDLTYLDRLRVPNLEVRRHNILDDPLDSLEPGSFDVVCSRLTLFWLAGRQMDAIRRMVECLRPGGWLLDEDGDWGMAGPVDPFHRLYDGYHGAYRHGGWFASRGYDPLFGRKLSSLFENSGLVNIDHHATAEVVRGGSPWARWWRDTLDAIRDWGLPDNGAAESADEDHEALTSACIEPSVWLMTELLHACRGQRPG